MRRARRRVRGWVRVTTATAVVLVVSLWAAWPAGAGDPLGEIKEFTAGLTPNSGPNRITEGPDGNLWFTERANPGRIGRITPTGTIDEFTAGLTPNSAPVGIAAGPDANLWFTENANPGRIGKIGAGCVPVPAPVETQPRFTG